MRKDFLFVTTHYSFSSLSSKQGRGFALGNRCSFPNRDKKKKNAPKVVKFLVDRKDLLACSHACIFLAFTTLLHQLPAPPAFLNCGYMRDLHPKLHSLPCCLLDGVHIFFYHIFLLLFSLRYPTILFAHFSSSVPLLPSSSWTFSFV